ncbi:MAG TPA: response regulator [Pyrinomonadaceae bacterium]|nr:response regulator [Pyrinomonadaceae bacterium]
MPQTKCRVLCIDDHEDTSEMLKLLLIQEDYEVVIALSCEQALQLVEKEEFDLYVLDRRLPDGSGLQLCKDLSKATPGVPTIFYSGDAYEIHRSEALAAGANDYVTKPDIDRLIDCVHELLSARQCAKTA